jgi:beta-glucosidase
VLTGTVNPSGRLPVTFPESLAQTPRPELPGMGTPWGTPTTIEYDEGAEVGYRWFARTGARPMYAFGHGPGYTTFDYRDLQVGGGETVTATFTVTNTGERAGADVPQLYLAEAAGEERMRLLGFERVELGRGVARRDADHRSPAAGALRRQAGRWRIAEGTYRVALGRAADDLVLTSETRLAERRFGS